jgi:hypothetical protein
VCWVCVGCVCCCVAHLFRCVCVRADVCNNNSLGNIVPRALAHRELCGSSWDLPAAPTTGSGLAPD